MTHAEYLAVAFVFATCLVASLITTFATAFVLTIIGPYPTLGLVSCAAAYQIFRAYRTAR